MGKVKAAPAPVKLAKQSAADTDVLAVTGAAPWRPVLDEATARFRSSGAPEGDVRAALKNHMRVDELDLGPDPDLEPESNPKAPVPPGTPAPAPEAKGLPSLRLSKPSAKK
ncbi:uncharacterized protein HaLaN_15968, partial [Haematococcus lacustris]